MAEGRSAGSQPGDRSDRVRGHHPDTQLLEKLGDPGCRAILAATGRPRTASELAESCDMPTSTVYRKLEELTEVGLLEGSRRLRDHGNHPLQYRRQVDHLLVDFDGGDVTVHPGTEYSPRPG